jgi:predicted nucleic acid-binding protein
LLILDTGSIRAIIDAADSWHQRCLDLSESSDWNGALLPSTVLVELDHFLRQLPPAAWSAFASDVLDGNYQIEIVTLNDYERAFELCREYQYMKLQLVDASIVALAERLNTKDIATVDRRDFRRITPRHCSAFDLYPVGPDLP